MNRILHITPDFNYVCGRSKLVYLYLKYFSNHPEYEIHFITNGGDSLDRLNELTAVKIKKLNFSTGIKNLLFYQNFYTNLNEYVLEHKIDLIHTHHRFPELLSSVISKRKNVKTVTTAHSFVRGFKELGFNSDKVIAVSNSVRGFLIKNYKVTSDRILTLYNPVDKSQIDDETKINLFRTEKKISKENKIILFVGRLCRDKGFDNLVKAFEIIKANNENAILIAVGQVVENEKVYSSFLNSERIIYVLPQKSIQSFYEISDVVVLPSRIEPFGYTMLESGVSKKPFIGGNTGGIAEFIEDGENGLLVDPKNPKQLAEKILYLLRNPELAKTLGENLNKKVSRMCNFNNYFSQVEKIYSSLIESE